MRDMPTRIHSECGSLLKYLYKPLVRVWSVLRNNYIAVLSSWNDIVSDLKRSRCFTLLKDGNKSLNLPNNLLTVTIKSKWWLLPKLPIKFCWKFTTLLGELPPFNVWLWYHLHPEPGFLQQNCVSKCLKGSSLCSTTSLYCWEL
jgi:hypothetical protein